MEEEQGGEERSEERGRAGKGQEGGFSAEGNGKARRQQSGGRGAFPSPGRGDGKAKTEKRCFFLRTNV